MGSSTPSQLREIRSSFKMPPITDDEVIDAAAAEKTEDATDGKAAEAEAKEEAVRKERRRGKRVENSLYDNESQQHYRNQIQKMVLFLSTQQKMKNLTQKTPQTFRRKSLEKKIFLPLLNFNKKLDDEITVFWPNIKKIK